MTTLQFAGSLTPVPIDPRVGRAWAGLIALLTSEGRRAPIKDIWIAATAIVNDMVVITQDSDFDNLSGVEVIRL